MQTLGRWRNWLAERAVDTAGWKRAAECGQFAPGTTDRDRREPYTQTLGRWRTGLPRVLVVLLSGRELDADTVALTQLACLRY